MERPQRKRLRLESYDYSQPGYYFITICTKERHQNILCSLDLVGAAVPGGPQVPLPRPDGSQDAIPSPCCPWVALTPVGEIVERLILRIDAAYRGVVSVDTYCIMPDHLHLILVIRPQMDGPPGAAAPTGIPAVVNALKGLASKQIGHSIWQRGYYDHIIRSDTDLAETRQYLLHNPLHGSIRQG